MNKKKFFDETRESLFRGSFSQEQVDGINGILKAFTEVGDDKEKTLAYALATAYHETGGRMSPVRETFANTDAQAIARLDAWAKKTGRTNNIYWRPQPPYGHAYFGRGQIQLTWKDNYKNSSDDAGVDLVQHPNKMLDPEISSRVLIKGLIDGRWNAQGKGIDFYLSKNDLKNARRTVNVLDKWDTVRDYYKNFLIAIKKSGGVPKKQTKKPVKEPETSNEEPSLFSKFNDWFKS